MSTQITTVTESWLDHRGIRIVIRHPHGNYKFCGYLFLLVDNFQDEAIREALWLTPDQAEYQAPVINNIELHGGVTYYRRHSPRRFFPTPYESRVIEVGCDYNHLYDGGETLTGVIQDMKHSVDCLHEEAVYLLHCRGNGKLYPESEGAYRNDAFYSNEYTESKAVERVNS